MKSQARMVVAILLSLSLCSCKGLDFFRRNSSAGKNPEYKIEPPPKVKVDIQKQADKVGVAKSNVETEVKVVETETAVIKTETGTGKQVAPDLPQWENIERSAVAIEGSIGAILESTETLGEVETELAKGNVEVKALETHAEKQEKVAKQVVSDNKALLVELEKKEKKLQEYKEGAKQRQQKIWMSVVGFSAILMVFGVFLAVYSNPKMGVSLVISSVACASIAYFMAEYAGYVALAGGSVVLISFGYLVYYTAVHRKALVESIMSFEIAKGKDWENEKTKTEVSSIQSNVTKKLVSDIRFKERIGK